MQDTSAEKLSKDAVDYLRGLQDIYDEYAQSYALAGGLSEANDARHASAKFFRIARSFERIVCQPTIERAKKELRYWQSRDWKEAPAEMDAFSRLVLREEIRAAQLENSPQHLQP